MKKNTLFGKWKSFPIIGKTLLVVCALIVIGCVSLSLSVNMGPKVDPAFFQSYKEANERLVYFAPLKAPNHNCSYLYVITNPEDIQKAQDKMGKVTTASMQDIGKGLVEFSPIMIASPTNNDEGIGIFHLPASANKVFYAYIPYRTGDTLSNTYQAKVYCGIFTLPSGSDDVFVEFSEQRDVIKISTTRRLEDIKNIFKTRINGPYAWYVATRTPRAGKNKPQTGFIEFFVKEYAEAVPITPLPQNIAVPTVRDRYVVPVVPTLVGEYSNYKITAHDIVGSSNPNALSKQQILDWLALNKDNADFNNALAICMIIADKYEFKNREFVCVDYCAMFIGIDASVNNSRLEKKIWLTQDKDHIWMGIDIPNKYYDANGNVRQSAYLWVDPTWFDNGNAYNLNFFTWGGDYVPQFMEAPAINGDYCHKKPERIKWGQYGHVPGFTWSIIYRNGSYYCVQDDFGRRRS